MPPIVVISIVISVIILVLLIAAVVLVFPGKKKNIDSFLGIRYAHRGLHNGERAENSLSAMKAAVDGGYGIELDIRLSSDGKLVVFHDDTLDRVCGREGRVLDFTAEELSTFKLCGTEDGIPTFDEVLEVVGGKVPLLVEIKENSGDSSVSEAAIKRLSEYDGPYIVESFNPLTVARVSKAMPDVTCGFLAQHFTKKEECKKPLYFALENLLLNRLCNPSFIAYRHDHYYMPALRLSRLLGARAIAWTVRSPEEERAALEHGFKAVIFENYIPAEDLSVEDLSDESRAKESLAEENLLTENLPEENVAEESASTEECARENAFAADHSEEGDSADNLPQEEQ